MWKARVVHERHRRRHILLWTILITGILAYIGWALSRRHHQYLNPSTSFSLSNEVYRYPDLGVCLYEENGCDSLDDHIAAGCVNSSNSTEFGPSTAEYRGQELSPTDGVWIPDTTEDETKRQSIDVDPRFTGPEKKYCVLFNMSAIEHTLGEERALLNYLDYTNLRMAWYPSGSKENDSNTCTTDSASRAPHRKCGNFRNCRHRIVLQPLILFYKFAILFRGDQLRVFKRSCEHENLTDTIASGFQVAYSCRENTSDTHMFTDIVLALTETKKLGGTTTRSYRANTIYSYPYVSDQVGENIPNITRPYAFIDLRIKQGPNSLETITEDAPVPIGELLGDIGGFWDILLLLWPLFFVVVSQQEPTLKPRDFRKALQKGTGRVMKCNCCTRSGTAQEEMTARGDFGTPISIRNNRTSVDVSGSLSGRPREQDRPRRTSWSSAV
ncbi:unnamed protein product [Pylaiella littoralis]